MRERSSSIWSWNIIVLVVFTNKLLLSKVMQYPLLCIIIKSKSRCTGSLVDYKFYWDRLLYCCRLDHLPLRGTLWNFMCSIFMQEIIPQKHSTVSKMRYWRTLKEFPRVEPPSVLRSAITYSTGRSVMHDGLKICVQENPAINQKKALYTKLYVGLLCAQCWVVAALSMYVLHGQYYHTWKSVRSVCDRLHMIVLP